MSLCFWEMDHLKLLICNTAAPKFYDHAGALCCSLEHAKYSRKVYKKAIIWDEVED